VNPGISIAVFDKATPELLALVGQIKDPGSLLLPVARQGSNILRRHFRDLDTSRPNRLGGMRQHWYSRVAESVANPAVESPALATIDIAQQGFALRLRGGIVRPLNASALAIPVAKESYGVWARDWIQQHPDMPLFKIRGARGMYLATRVGDTRSKGASRKRGASSSIGPRRLKILYVLRQSVKIPADPSLLPPAEQFRASLCTYAQQRLATLIKNRPA
jgi:hypothetical protein